MKPTVLLIAAILTSFLGVPTTVAQPATSASPVQAKVTEEMARCQQEKLQIPGIQQLELKYPGAFEINEKAINRLDHILALPDQDTRPTADEAKVLIASIRVGFACRERIKDIMRPVLGPSAITYLEANYYQSEGRNLQMITNNTPYRQMNQERVETIRLVRNGIAEINKRTRIGTKAANDEVVQMAKDAETNLFNFIEQYDRDVISKKTNGYSQCEWLGPYEICTK